MEAPGRFRCTDRGRIAAGLIAACAIGCAREGEARSSRPGLAVGKGGTILRDGKPYRAIGVNYFDAFCRTLKGPKDTSCREGFAELACPGDRRGRPVA